MNRRKAIKGLTALSTLSILPLNFLFSQPKNKTIHFVGIGNSSSNALTYLQRTNTRINTKYTLISDLREPGISSKINFIKYIYIPPKPICDFDRLRSLEIKYTPFNRLVTIPNKIESLFNKTDRYILLNGFEGLRESFLARELTLMLYNKSVDFLTIFRKPSFNYSYLYFIKAEVILESLQSIQSVKYFYSDMLKGEKKEMHKNIIETAYKQYYFDNNFTHSIYKGASYKKYL